MMKHNHDVADLIVDTDDHGHILFVYSTKARRMQVLAEYFQEGLDNNELCILATPDSPAQTIKEFSKAGLDIKDAVKHNKFRMFDMTKTYLPEGEFSSNGMLTNVVNFIISAKTEGYNGVRTAGEMAWLYDHPEFLAHASHYEQQINDLHATNPEFTGMCMYPIIEDTDGVIDASLGVHPSFVQDGIMQTNPLFKAAA